MGNLEIVAASWESITKLVSFSVFSCRTIINSSPRRRERMRYSRGGCRAPVSKPPPSFFSPLGTPTDGWSVHVDHCTGPRGASMEPPAPPRPLVDGNTSSAHVIRKQKPVGSSKQSWKQQQPHCSCTKSSSTSNLPPPPLWKLLSRELRRVTTSAGCRPVVDQ